MGPAIRLDAATLVGHGSRMVNGLIAGARNRNMHVRLRAERRVGELLKELARSDKSEAGAAGGHAKAASPDDATKQPPSPYAQTLGDLGMSRQTWGSFSASKRRNGLPEFQQRIGRAPALPRRLPDGPNDIALGQAEAIHPTVDDPARRASPR